MDFRICIDSDDDGQDLMSLHRWLVDDPDVTRQVVLGLELGATSKGEMGGVFDAITATLSDGIALGSLIVAYQSWRDSRPRTPAVSIECRGTVVNLTDSSPETVRRVVEALVDQIESDHGESV